MTEYQNGIYTLNVILHIPPRMILCRVTGTVVIPADQAITWPGHKSATRLKPLTGEVVRAQ